MLANRDCALFAAGWEDWFCEEVVEDEDMLAKRDWSSFICDWGGLKAGFVAGEAARPPMSKPGTEMPAWPRRFTAPWSGVGTCVASEYAGGGAGVFKSGCEFCRGGRRGGSAGCCLG